MVQPGTGASQNSFYSLTIIALFPLRVIGHDLKAKCKEGILYLPYILHVALSGSSDGSLSTRVQCHVRKVEITSINSGWADFYVISNSRNSLFYGRH
jgi:hypothetical protein